MAKRARWQLFDLEHAAIVGEIEKQSDRAAAILATSLLDQCLADCIKLHFVKEDAVIHRIFTGQGGLSSLSAKIDIGLLLGISNKRDHRQLRTIRDIRNKFAHQTQTLTFQSQGIRDLCHNLPAPIRRRPQSIDDDKKMDDLRETNPLAYFRRIHGWIASGKDTPRNRFIFAVRWHYFCLSTVAYGMRRLPDWRPGLSRRPPLPDRSPSRHDH